MMPIPPQEEIIRRAAILIFLMQVIHQIVRKAQYPLRRLEGSTVPRDLALKPLDHAGWP